MSVPASPDTTSWAIAEPANKPIEQIPIANAALVIATIIATTPVPAK